MAKIHEEVLVIKVSTLLPDDRDMGVLMTEENISALRQVIEQLAGDSKTLVEIESA